MHLGQTFRRSQLALLFLVFLGLSALCWASRSGQQKSISESTESRLDRVTLPFSINSKLPEFRFQVVLKTNDPDSTDSYQSVQSIDVYSGTADHPAQTLTGCDLEDSDFHDDINERFKVEDLDFDGYKDIYLLTQRARNWAGCIWLYNATAGKFEFSREFTDTLDRFTLDPKTRSIFSFSGIGNDNYQVVQYEVRDHRLTKVLEVKNETASDGARETCTVWKLRSGKKVRVFNRTIDSDDAPRSASCGSGFIPDWGHFE
ncbi:MAG TPA: hypothetical protein VKB38_18785 [Terracidiphilus sp.]|nr:hypothetical protein [Terracidiphilus sp.]